MSSLFKPEAVKWWVLATISFFILILAGFGFSVWQHQRRLELAKEARLEAERKYEDKFRSGMVRIYQNLKLDHFLAAYKNLETMPKPRRSDAQKMQEYIDILYRIGRGLLENQLLKESENIFLQIREYEGQITTANESLGRIESQRRLENAKVFMEDGARLMANHRYREANQEFQKAQIEIRSVENLGFDDIAPVLEALQPQMKEARFYTLMEDANKMIAEAEYLLQEGRFKELNEKISRSAAVLGRAAFIRPRDPLVKAARSRLLTIDSEIGFRLPNSLPLWNFFKKEDQDMSLHYFRLEEYAFSPKVNEKGEVALGLHFSYDPREKYYIVRYRIYFQGGRSVFNGHFISPEQFKASELIQSVEYLQEIPDALRTTPIVRMEIKVFNSLDQIVSRVERAFRVS